MNKKFFTMLIIAVLFFSFLGFFAAKMRSLGNQNAAPTPGIDSDSYYTCPMHPEVHQDHPGNCPICHMTLVKVSGKPKEISVTPAQLTEIGVAKIKAEIKDLEIEIPFSGRMTTSQTLSFQIYESDLNLVKAGLALKGQNSHRPEQEIKGVIHSVDSIIDPSSRTVRVVATVKSGSLGLVPESTISGSILVLLKNRLTIPEDAVIHTGRGDIVYLILENKLHPKIVRLGHKSAQFFEVLEGLQSGDEIASGPNFLLDSEAKIRGVQ